MNISRRSAMTKAAFVAGLAATPALATGEDRPNILWLVSEDNNPWYGCYGDTLAHTPNIDAMAKLGIVYKRAYSTAPVCAPSRFALLTGVHAESAGPAHHMRATAKAVGILPIAPDLLRKSGYYCTNNVKTDYNCDVDPSTIWDEISPKAHWKNRPAGKPFFSMVTLLTSHESQNFRPTEGKVKPDQVRLPDYLPDTPGIRQDFASYYNRLELMDGQIGEALAELEAAGLADNTIVFHFSDNGGVMPRSKRYCHEEGLRCALVVRFPPKWSHLAPAPAGSAIETPVSFIDLPPTLLALAGVPQPKAFQGRPLTGKMEASRRIYAFGMRSRMDERYDFVRTVSDGRYRYIRNYMPHLPTVQNQAFSWLAKGNQEWDRLRIDGKLTAKQRTPFEKRPFEELYDLHNDPDQMDNLVVRPEFSAKANELRRALDAHMIRVVDNGFIPEGSRFEGYVPSRARGAYPLKRLMALAQAGARRDSRKVKLLVAALSDANEVIRYWGAMGLTMLGEGARAYRSSLSAIMNDDPSPQVRVAAAEAVAFSGEHVFAVRVLARLLGNDQTFAVRLMALNVLTRLGQAARPALPQIKALQTVNNEYLPNAATYLIQQLDGTYDPAKPVFDMERMLRNPPK